MIPRRNRPAQVKRAVESILASSCRDFELIVVDQSTDRATEQALAAIDDPRLRWHPVLPIVTPPLLCSAVVALTITALPRALDHWWWLELAVGTAVPVGCMLAFESRFRHAFRAAIRRW